MNLALSRERRHKSAELAGVRIEESGRVGSGGYSRFAIGQNRSAANARFGLATFEADFSVKLV